MASGRCVGDGGLLAEMDAIEARTELGKTYRALQAFDQLAERCIHRGARVPIQRRRRMAYELHGILRDQIHARRRDFQLDRSPVGGPPASIDQALGFERNQRLRRRPLGRPEEIGERAGRARIPVGAREKSQRFPLSRVEAHRELEAVRDTPKPIQQFHRAFVLVHRVANVGPFPSRG